jgi:hypothetical protein
MNGAKLPTNAFAAASEKAPTGRNTNRRRVVVVRVTEVVYPPGGQSRGSTARSEGEDAERVPRWGKA